ncbi:formimidoyltransferase-cyclodeaminase-like isoform X1 [Octopus sinensis]|uniref:Formimidoyltransferase-cyclodeaminase n=2 Tax=Octopus sinensis TaxID=2607531 RepID=A0A7E6F4A8_9MOLL|nr:formimidoyltransferase-cyclodeaminase-like isoform X1 [Octopus sinensis]
MSTKERNRNKSLSTGFYRKMFANEKIIECVPNFSEGSDQKIIDAISNAIAETNGCSLLDVDNGPSANRTVYTFVGSPEAVVEGALRASREAFKLIDLSQQHGEHPRIGSLDVCPFIPVRGATMDDCVKCSEEFADKLSKELNIPVYLYGASAKKPDRTLLANIRAGEYEGLQAKLKDPEWKPDYGPAAFVERWGATVTGARKYLIAFNVNLISTKEQAHRIALMVREQGRKDRPHSLKKLQGIGWYLQENNLAQVSMNILDYEVTSLHTVFEEVKKCADGLKLPVVGSQIVGLIPLQAVLSAAEYYMKTEQLFVLDEDQKVSLVINRLGLNSLGPFNPKEKIIEFMLKDESNPLLDLKLSSFIESVGSRTAVPGGGSVAALCASLGVGLFKMVGLLTYGKKQFDEVDPIMRRLIPQLHEKILELKKYIDADSAAFNKYMAALKMPESSEKEKESKEKAKEESLANAIGVPMNLARIISEVWPLLQELSLYGNVNCLSDLQTGIRMLEAATWGANYNIKINLKNITDTDKQTKILEEIDGYQKLAEQETIKILSLMENK